MKYMLDTNICSYIIKKKPLHILDKLNSVPIDACCISAITLAELRFWVSKNKRLHMQSNNPGEPNINSKIIDNFVDHLVISEFDSLAAEYYGEVRATLSAQGLLIGSEDLLIAAHALSMDCILVTNNLREFNRVPELLLEDWSQ